MRRSILAAAAAALAGALLAAPASARPPAAPGGAPTTVRACDTPKPRHAACFALVDADSAGKALAGPALTQLAPYTAADLQDAYKLPSALLGARQTVAIVDAYDDPNAEADLAAYRAANNLPACDADFPCFTKVDQRGGTDYPTADAGWALEVSLDVDMVSAACPNCRILLVEADDNSDTNLAAAVDEAVALGADAVSNSYGATEYNGEQSLAADYTHPGVAIVASTGDSGFGVSEPAAFPTVTAVGGTTLYRDSSARGWSEQGWSGAGSGCSAYLAKPSWQKDRKCHNRAVADVSAVADPDTPVAVYDTYGYAGWIAVGGTSAASPIIAGVYALAGNTASVTSSYPYAHAGALFDVTGGPANGNCGHGYLCTPTTGYDGPTGLGTPNGIGAF